jgi:hypothetical protein
LVFDSSVGINQTFGNVTRWPLVRLCRPHIVGIIMDRTHSFWIALTALGVSSMLGAAAVLIWARTSSRRYHTQAASGPAIVIDG